MVAENSGSPFPHNKFATNWITHDSFHINNLQIRSREYLPGFWTKIKS